MNDAPERLGLAVVRDALLVPPEAGPSPVYPFVHAVYDAAGHLVPEAAWRHRALDLSIAPPRPPVRRIAGRHVYGGVLVPHFGHGLIEGLARAWHLRAAPATPVLWHRQGPGVSRDMATLLGFVGLAAPEGSVLAEPVTVEELVVPQQGCVFGGWFHPAQAAALGVAPFGPPRAGLRVWLSRSALPDGVARVEGEAALEARLAEAGWTVLRPEAMALAEQLAALAGAERIAGFMGSALHLPLLFDRVPARVSILSRGLHRDLVRTYEAIAAAKGLDQEILPVAFDGAPAVVGPRQSVRLADPAAVAAALLAG